MSIDIFLCIILLKIVFTVSDFIRVNECIAKYEPSCLTQIDPHVEEYSNSSQLHGWIFRFNPYDSVWQVNNCMHQHGHIIDHKPQIHLSYAVHIPWILIEYENEQNEQKNDRVYDSPD